MGELNFYQTFVLCWWPVSPCTPGSVCRYGAHDECLHESLGQPLYNESVYFNFVTRGAGAGPLGGILRVGLRPTDGYAELSLNLPLDGGTTIFLYEREPLDQGDFHPGAATWRCAGMELAAIEPLYRWRLRYDGSGPRRLLDARAFGAHPGATLRDSPLCTVSLELEFEAGRPIHALSASGDIVAGAGVAFARDHYEQFGRISGTISVDGQRWSVGGDAFRDHSWGPRDWQSAPFSDFATLIAADGSAIVAFSVRIDGRDHVQGVRWDDHGLERLAGFSVATDYAGGVEIGRSLGLTFTLPSGSLSYDGAVRAFLPLRHRSGERTVRIGQVLVMFEGSGDAAWGWSDLTRPASA